MLVVMLVSRSLGFFGLWLFLAKRPGYCLPGGLHSLNRQIDHPVDRLINRLACLIDRLANRATDISESKQTREETNCNRNRLRQCVLDHLRCNTDVSFYDRRDRIDDCVDEIDDLRSALDKEDNDVVDCFTRFEECRHGIQQTNDPSNSSNEHLFLDEVEDGVEHHRLQLEDLLLY